MTLFHTCCEILHPSGGDEGEWEEDSSGGRVDWPLCVPQPWREIDAHGEDDAPFFFTVFASSASSVISSGRLGTTCWQWAKCADTTATTTFAFKHAGPSTWSALPNSLKCNTHSLSTLRLHLKHFYFSFYYHTHRVRRYYLLTVNVLYMSTKTCTKHFIIKYMHISVVAWTAPLTFL